MNVSLTKSGRFEAHFQGNPDHKCGSSDQQHFDFIVTINGTDEALSPEGFLIENSRVNKYFELVYGKPTAVRSCEQIACAAAKAIGQRLLSEGISVQSVLVSISGTPGANLTAHWTVPSPTRKSKAAATKPL